jgi:hypothetical protein
MLAIAQQTKSASRRDSSGWGIHSCGRKWWMRYCTEVAREDPELSDSRH